MRWFKLTIVYVQTKCPHYQGNLTNGEISLSYCPSYDQFLTADNFRSIKMVYHLICRKNVLSTKIILSKILNKRKNQRRNQRKERVSYPRSDYSIKPPHCMVENILIGYIMAWASTESDRHCPVHHRYRRPHYQKCSQYHQQPTPP